MPKNQENDLSEYEKVRLANINRNADFLRSIGLNIQADNGVEGFRHEAVVTTRNPKKSR